MARNRDRKLTTPICRIALEAKSLGHSWFLHSFCDQLNHDIETGRVTSSTLPEYVRVLPTKLARARYLLQAATEAFSPRVLVDAGPLARLPKVVRDVVRQGVHEDYLRMNKIQPLCAALELAIEDLEARIPCIGRDWFGEGRAKMTQKLLAGGLRVSRALEDLFDKTDQGRIVLP